MDLVVSFEENMGPASERRPAGRPKRGWGNQAFSDTTYIGSLVVEVAAAMETSRAVVGAVVVGLIDSDWNF